WANGTPPERPPHPPHPPHPGDGPIPFAGADLQVYVVDANKGAVLSTSVANHDFSTWSVDLRAEVAGDAVTSYSWDYNQTAAPDVSNPSGGSSYHLQFTWADFSGAPHTDTIGLTVTAATGSRTLSFTCQVASHTSAAWSSAPTSASTWPTVVTPDMFQADAAAQPGPHHDVTLADGSLSTEVDLPAYNPGVAPLR